MFNLEPVVPKCRLLLPELTEGLCQLAVSYTELMTHKRVALTLSSTSQIITIKHLWSYIQSSLTCNEHKTGQLWYQKI